MKNKKLLSTFTIFSIALLSIGMVAAFGPAQGKGNGQHIGYGLMDQDLSEAEIAEMQTFRDSMIQAIEDNDFSTWKSLMESQLTQEKFDKIVEKHSERSEINDLHEQMQEAWDNDDYETVKELKEKLGDEQPGKTKFRGMEKDQEDRDGVFFHKLRFW